MSMVCRPPDPLPTPSCLSWLAGMVKTVCWELGPPEWIFSIPADQTQDTLHERPNPGQMMGNMAPSAYLTESLPSCPLLLAHRRLMELW